MRRKFRSCDIVLRNTRNILCFFAILSVLFIYRTRKIHSDRIRSKLSKNAIKFIDFQELNYESLQIDTLKKVIFKYNQEERILNADVYEAMKDDAPIFVIFTDKYKANLKYLIASLEHVLGIADALIIFSHSYFDENVNSLIKSIDFTRVMQIFYPYSIQAFPQEFPGHQSGDCTRFTGIDNARSINCTGANTPDIHGRYRDPILSQTKHFWWWTLNTVFEKLSHTKNHKGMYIFIDDDVFLLEDSIYMTLQMKKISKLVSQCDIVSLMRPGHPNFSETRTYGADLSTWDPKQHSSVIAFDLQVWNSIAAHYFLFCTVDDYSWSRSLFHVSMNRRDGSRFKVISSTVPRAYQTSKVSSFSKQIEEYSIMNSIYEVLEMQKRNQETFFPSQLEVYLNIELEYDEFEIFDYTESNGGWADIRDKQMCTNITANKVKKLLLDMNGEFNHYKNDDDVPEMDEDRSI
ncbi:unnamed protein product [Arctia plantaginis]|uniref:Alpha-1,6-mannosyl-glycoprotein 2-beta-N-acetylglucosaminyltransferase n=1 Tax=Arctia plantaginis TaxID=874455 RepID=A0A8S0ZZY0_ARCPL|nr:unnamed protein product [Arctia plantaginis]